MIFKKNQQISWDGDGYFSCVCCDEEVAVFAPVVLPKELEGCTSHVDYRSMFVVQNDSDELYKNKYTFVKF